MPLRTQLQTPENFNFREILWFLDRGFDDCLHKVNDETVTKLLRIDGELCLFKLACEKRELTIEVLSGNPSPASVKAYISEWLDLEKDIAPFKEIASRDPDLLALVEKYWGLRLISIPDLFEVLCWSIIGQQINLTFAYKLKRQLVEASGQKLSWEGDEYHVFPTPARLSELSFGDLKGMQYSAQKANYLLETARIFAEQEWSREMLLALGSTQEMLRKLMSLKGVGEWTANYVAMKCLRRPDAITYGDAGLLNGYKKMKGLQAKPERKDLDVFFGLFPNWEAYTVFYIWRSLS